jgi:hypothetical protein
LEKLVKINMNRMGIYIVTLNNEELISVNANDKRVADKAIKVNKFNCKVGKAKDLEKRKKNYFRTFGKENVNFTVLSYTTEIDIVEKQILKKLDNHRIKGRTGRKNEWLQNITSESVIENVCKVLIENGYNCIGSKF